MSREFNVTLRLSTIEDLTAREVEQRLQDAHLITGTGQPIALYLPPEVIEVAPVEESSS